MWLVRALQRHRPGALVRIYATCGMLDEAVGMLCTLLDALTKGGRVVADYGLERAIEAILSRAGGRSCFPYGAAELVSRRLSAWVDGDGGGGEAISS